MAYIRHRPRMVRQSVLEDLRATLIQLDWVPDDPNWKPGDPYDADQFLGMLSSPVVVEDYFPVEAVYQGEAVEVNTLSIDQGTPQEPVYVEMGGEDRAQDYVFNFAFFAENDAVALALFSDLTDRYKGLLRYPDGSRAYESIALFNYLAATPNEVVRMEVTSFEVAKSPQQPAPGRLLWFAQLVITDYLELD